MLSLRGEWELVPGWGRGSAFTPASAALAVPLAALAGHFGHLRWWHAVLAGLAGAAAVVLTAARSHPGGGVAAHRAVSAACAAGWTAWAWVGEPWPQARFPWTAAWLGAWAAGAAVLGGSAVVRGRRVQAVERRRVALLTSPAARRREKADEWAALIRGICRVPVEEILNVEAWPPTATCEDPGFTVEARLGGGRTWSDVAAYAPNLASKARLPHGCRVNVSEGDGADLVLLDVATHDTLADEVPYPEDCEPRSVNDDYAIGVRRDGSEYLVNTREDSVFVGGQKGGGKTNIANVFIARDAEAVDGITCVIDLKGDLIPPWVQPYLEGRAERPAVDWPARTVEQGIRMCEALIRAGDARAAAPENIRLKREHDSNLLPLDATRPQFNLIIDEGKGITGTNVRDPQLMKLAGLIETIREKYRSQGLNVKFTCLRTIATATSGTDARVQSAILILVKSKTEEIRNTFDNTSGITAADIPNKGNMLVAEDSDRPEPIQGFHLKPQGIDRVAVKTGSPDYHPDPEPVALAALGDAWENRWDPEEVAWLLDGADNVPVDTPRTPSASGPDGSDPMAGVGEALADLERIAERLRGGKPPADDVGEVPESGATDDAVKRRFDEIMMAEWGRASETTGGTPGDGSGRTSPDPQVRMLELLREAGPGGIRVGTLHAFLVAEGLTTKSRQAVHDWLRAAVARGQVVQPAERGPYIHIDHHRG